MIQRVYLGLLQERIQQRWTLWDKDRASKIVGVRDLARNSVDWLDFSSSVEFYRILLQAASHHVGVFKETEQ